MSPQLTKITAKPAPPFRLATAFFLLPFLATAASSDSGETTPSWEDLATDAAEMSQWSADPLAEVLPQPSPWTFGTSLAGAFGYSDNFLKRSRPVSSPLFLLNADAFANYLGAAHSITALAFFEYTAYDHGPDSADDESIAYFMASYETVASHGTRYGIETNALYLDQIYDASLFLTSQPVGERLRRFRPQLSLFSVTPLSRRDNLRVTFEFSHNFFDDASEDYSRPAVAVQWTRQWLPSLQSVSSLEVATERYSDRLARRATGLLLPTEQALRLRVASLEHEFSWEPPRHPDMELTSVLGFRREYDASGQYNDNRLFYAALASQTQILFMEFELSARWQNRRYLERITSLTDRRTLHQIVRTVSARLSAPITEDLSASVEWATTDFASRNPSSSYAENRVLALLRWTY